MVDKDFCQQIAGRSLTTAEILYHLPDHPSLLQSFLWQQYDLAPKFPKLCGFLDFWAHNLDGTLESVRVAHRELMHPADFRFVDGTLVFN